MEVLEFDLDLLHSRGVTVLLETFESFDDVFFFLAKKVEL